MAEYQVQIFLEVHVEDEPRFQDDGGVEQLYFKDEEDIICMIL